MRVCPIKWGRVLRGIAILAFLVSVSACKRTTPPGADIVAAKMGNAAYTFLHWKQGLRVMIWYDVADQVWSESAGSTSDPIHRVEGYASALNGRRVDWRLETADGETATFILDGQQYDPSGGVLFLVSTKDGETQVRQLSRDLSTVQPTNQSCEAFAEADADVSRFTRSSEPPR